MSSRNANSLLSLPVVAVALAFVGVSACGDGGNSPPGQAVPDAGDAGGPVMNQDASTSPGPDATAPDGGGGPPEAGARETGGGEAGPRDGGAGEAGPLDGGAAEAGQPDGGAAEAGAAIEDAAVDVMPDTANPSSMSFFVTSVGSLERGGNLGGLSGADATCQTLASAAGAGHRTWRAYLSSSSVDARDRIGTGPWHNAKGELVAASVDALHAAGAGRGPAIALIVDERGAPAPRAEHDILTGSTVDGRKTAATCNDWTSSSDSSQGRVGHADWSNYASGSWNSVHTSPCSQTGLASNNGGGRLYCFAGP